MTVGRLAGRRVLVTGASGFLGRHLVPALQREGAEVHAAYRRQAVPPVPGVHAHVCDLRDQGAIDATVHAVNPDIVVHLAAYGAVREQHDEATMWAVNVEGTRALWQALDRRVRFVMTGTCAEYGDVSEPANERMPCRPLSPYARSKHEAARFVVDAARATSRAAVVLRPYGAYGPDDHPGRVLPATIVGLLRGEVVALTEGGQVRDFCHVTDQVEAIVRAAVQPDLPPGVIYNVGTGVGAPLREVLEMTATLVGGPGRLAFGRRPYRGDEPRYMVPDVSAAARDLGFRATVALRDGLARTVAWYRHALGGADPR